MASEENLELLADLECGGSETEEDVSIIESVSANTREKKTLSKSLGGALIYNGSISSGSDTDYSSDGFLKTTSSRRVELFIEGSSGGEEQWDLVALLHKKKNPSDQRKKPSLKKASKPPRPPKGPSLNASDLKLVKELSEMAARKRARIERMKALRKMKEAKRQSSNSSIIALIITVFFFLVILFQGVLSRNNVHRAFEGSPAPAVASEGLISIQLFDNAPENKMNGPISSSLNSPEPVYRSSPREVEGRDTG